MGAGPEPQIGVVVGAKYRLTRQLGQGAMGSVYEAQHVEIGTRVAIKLLHPALCTDDDAIVRFRREAIAAGNSQSEHCAVVFDLGQTEHQQWYLVMELLKGADLHTILRASGPMPILRAVGIVHQASLGVRAAHAQGVIHRDIKPSNIFVSERSDGSDSVKVLDFGIAKLTTGDAQSRGLLLGTPAYMAPEQAIEGEEVDERADVYSLGAVLFECLTGSSPRTGRTQRELLAAILHGTPPAVRSLRAEVPEVLADAVHRALERSSSDRFQSVDEWIQALVPHLKVAQPAPGVLLKPGRRGKSHWPPAEPTRKVSSSSAPGIGTGFRWKGKHWLVAAGAAVALAVALVFVVYEPPAPPTPVPSEEPVHSAGAPGTASRESTPPTSFSVVVRATPTSSTQESRQAPGHAPSAQRPTSRPMSSVSPAPGAAINFDRSNPYGP